MGLISKFFVSVLTQHIAGDRPDAQCGFHRGAHSDTDGNDRQEPVRIL